MVKKHNLWFEYFTRWKSISNDKLFNYYCWRLGISHFNKLSTEYNLIWKDIQKTIVRDINDDVSGIF